MIQLAGLVYSKVGKYQQYLLPSFYPFFIFFLGFIIGGIIGAIGGITVFADGGATFFDGGGIGAFFVDGFLVGNAMATVLSAAARALMAAE